MSTVGEVDSNQQIVAIVISSVMNKKLQALLDRLNIEFNQYIVIEYQLGSIISCDFNRYFSDSGMKCKKDYDEKILFHDNEHLNKPIEQLKRIQPDNRYYVDSRYCFQRIEDINTYIIYEKSLSCWKLFSNFFRKSVTDSFDFNIENFYPISFRDIKIRIDTDKIEPCFGINQIETL